MKRVHSSNDAVLEAAQRVKNAEAIALPTETVYGIAARADTPRAVDKLYAIKGRDFTNPIGICLCDPLIASHYAVISPLAQTLIDHYWPGPFTLVLPRRRHDLDPRLYGKNSFDPAYRDTLALRCPDTAWARQFSDWGFISPIALTSANRSGEPSAKTAQDIVDTIGPQLSLIIDDGPSPLGTESTIVALNDNTVKILRHGAISKDTLLANEALSMMELLED